MNEGHGTGPQLVGQLTEDDPVGQSLGQVIRQRPLQLALKHLGNGKEGERSASPEEVPGWARRRPGKLGPMRNPGSTHTSPTSHTWRS